MSPTQNLIAAGNWVVCRDFALFPSTWGCVAWADGAMAHVRYGKDAPIWHSNLWEIAHLTKCGSEEEARKIVEDYRDSIEHDLR